MGGGYRIRLNEYDMLSFEKYMNISQQKKVSRTWFLGIEMNSPGSNVRILFFFEYAPQKILSKKNASRVSLTLAMFDGTLYRRLTSEPISLREIGFADGQPVFVYTGTAGSGLRNWRAQRRAVRSYG